MPKETKMVQKRPVGTSGLEVAPLALGGNVFDWTADEATSFAILDAFVDAGGTMIDTADVYSAWAAGHKGGESERLIGRWLKRSGRRGDVVIATKVGMMAGLAPDTIARLRCLARAARGRLHRHLFPAQGRRERAARRQPLRLRRLVEKGKIRQSACPTSPPSEPMRRWRPGGLNGLIPPARFSPGTISSSASVSKASCAMPR
jgi:diketogulonate reductase-like aldo/keto reductase